MEGDARYRVIVNTYFSLSGDVLMSFVISMFVYPNKKMNMVIITLRHLYTSSAIVFSIEFSW